MQMLIIFGVVIMWCRFVFTETEVTAATTAAATITTGYDTANNDTSLNKVNVKIRIKSISLI